MLAGFLPLLLVNGGLPAQVPASSAPPRFRVESNRKVGSTLWREYYVSSNATKDFVMTSQDDQEKRLEVLMPVDCSNPPLQLKKDGVVVLDELLPVKSDRLRELHKLTLSALEVVGSMSSGKPAAGLPKMEDLCRKMKDIIEDQQLGDARWPRQPLPEGHTFGGLMRVPTLPFSSLGSYHVKDEKAYWTERRKSLLLMESVLRESLKPGAAWICLVAEGRTNNKERAENEKWELVQDGKALDSLHLSGLTLGSAKRSGFNRARK